MKILFKFNFFKCLLSNRHLKDNKIVCQKCHKCQDKIHRCNKCNQIPKDNFNSIWILISNLININIKIWCKQWEIMVMVMAMDKIMDMLSVVVLVVLKGLDRVCNLLNLALKIEWWITIWSLKWNYLDFLGNY